MERFFKKNYILIIISSIIITVFISVLNAKNDSLIYDEIAHIPAGISYLQEHDLRLNPEHPPLLKNLIAIPLVLGGFNFDIQNDFWEENPNDAQWNAGKNFLYASGNNPEKIAFLARLPIILIFVILGLFIFKFTNEFYGISAGLLAFIFYIFSPNILGHNHYVTTDLGIAAFIVFVFYYFIKFIKRPSWKNTAYFGIFLGLVQLVKFSSVLIFPVFGLVILTYSWVKIPDDKKTSFKIKMKTFGEYLGKFSLALILSLILVWILYFANDFNMPKEKLPEIVNHYFAVDNTAAKFSKHIIFSLNDNYFLRPAAAYVFGVFRVFQRVVVGNVTYYFGEVSTDGFFSYFPIVYLLKEPLPILLLIGFAFFTSTTEIFKKIFLAIKSKRITLLKEFSHYIRNNIVEFTLLTFIFLYLFTSILGRLNIGFRHLFPIIPLIYILTAKKIVENKQRFKNNYLVISTFFFLIFYFIFGTFLAYPNYVSYFNEAGGGPKNGYHYVTDSNADWGQDLIRLREFLNKKPEIEKIRVDYFGIADINYYLGDKFEPWWSSRRPIEPGWYAISTFFRQEGIYDKRKTDNQSYRWLLNYKPVYQVGTSILIYNIP
ncbi:MAG: hypothetical protein COU40_00685 [Candidatus Moranbacteria bacterium CG10_big_fil_rev_8_21_14_0_10_35_21]|nr:MAG: hypothetical protein COU40_00685 [Candidatus Moranbacteria bacterium CG10_big_fil_rev_8_21_14_0_10_35_21]PJA88316.1 MAG: hypothetical protein CO139_03810 [Candidatus Moranbacteria bacterium CG_4_9_14_3_um_filter_36_9]